MCLKRACSCGYTKPSAENWEKEFDNIFPLAWFATENYTGKANEWEFTQWTEQQTKLANGRKELFQSFIRTLLARSLEEQRGRIEKEVKRLPVFKTDTAGGTREIVLLDDVLQLIQNIK